MNNKLYGTFILIAYLSLLLLRYLGFVGLIGLIGHLVGWWKGYLALWVVLLVLGVLAAAALDQVRKDQRELR